MCGEHYPNHTKNECRNVKYSNCHVKHPAFSRMCAIYKREKEIMYMKHAKNIPFPERRKIMKSCTGRKTYANVVQKANQTPHDSTLIDKYKELIEQLLNLNTIEWPRFQENLKRMYSTEMKQTKPCTKTNSDTYTNTYAEIPIEENSKMTEQTKEKRQRSPVQPLDTNKGKKENRLKDIAVKKTKPNKKNYTNTTHSDNHIKQICGI